MADAQLVSIELERFKSYAEPTKIGISPLTILIGRNNSGKSSIIQALLLLKQTLALPRSEVPLQSEGLINGSLRELTYGWPDSGGHVLGPKISLSWRSTVNFDTFLKQANKPDVKEIERHTDIVLKHWLEDTSKPQFCETTMQLEYAQSNGTVILENLTLTSLSARTSTKLLQGEISFHRQTSGNYTCRWGEDVAPALGVEFEHFLPYLLIDRKSIGPRRRERSFFNAFLLLFAQPLDDLKELLSSFAYLGSSRAAPSSLYRPATAPPEEIGISGEYAAQLLHKRSLDLVHYLPPLSITEEGITVPQAVRARRLVEAVNDILKEIGIETPLRIEDVKDLAFQIFFGKATLEHVGRGVNSILPVIALCLISDPLHFSLPSEDVPLEEYVKRCARYAHCALEEPEAHLHPKAQSRLAHWLVALAMARRQMIIETHSDHLVRRLRGLIARSAPGSHIESWLAENVSIIEVEQHEGKTSIRQENMTRGGDIEQWPADFMDEGPDEEREIYFARMDKEPPSVDSAEAAFRRSLPDGPTEG